MSATPSRLQRSLTSPLTAVSCLPEGRDKTGEGQCAKRGTQDHPSPGDGREQFRVWPWSLSPESELLTQKALHLLSEAGGQGQGSGPQGVYHPWIRRSLSFADNGLQDEEKLVRSQQQALRHPKNRLAASSAPGSDGTRPPPPPRPPHHNNRHKINWSWSSWLPFTLVLAPHPPPLRKRHVS